MHFSNLTYNIVPGTRYITRIVYIWYDTCINIVPQQIRTARGKLRNRSVRSRGISALPIHISYVYEYCCACWYCCIPGTWQVAYISTATYLCTHWVPQLSDFVPLNKDLTFLMRSHNKMKKCQLWDRGFRRNSSSQAAWDTSIARTTGFMLTRNAVYF